MPAASVLSIMSRRYSNFSSGQVSELVLLLQESLKQGFRPPLAVVQNVPVRIAQLLENTPADLERAIVEAPSERLRQQLQDTVLGHSR